MVVLKHFEIVLDEGISAERCRPGQTITGKVTLEAKDTTVLKGMLLLYAEYLLDTH